MSPLPVIATGLSAAGVTGAATGGGHDLSFVIELITSITGLLTGVASLVVAMRSEHREPEQPQVIVVHDRDTDEDPPPRRRGGR